MDEDSTVYKQLSKKTKTELVHTAIEYRIKNPDGMTREQLIKALIDCNIPEEPMFSAKRFLELDETSIFSFADGDEIVIKKENLKRAEMMVQNCIKDVFKILYGKI